MQGLTQLKSVALFVQKMACDSPPTHHIHLISHPAISFSSGMLRIASVGQVFSHVKNYLQQLLRQ
jgi:hypothetical protein